MDFLARDTVPFGDDFWKRLDDTIVDVIRKNMIGRKFLSLYGPLGAGAYSIQVDELSTDEESKEGVVKTTGRHFIELPQLYEDFTLLWRDIENSEKTGYPLDLSKAMAAAQRMALKEDKLVFFGNEFLGCEGLINASGVSKIEKGDWSSDEHAFTDVASALAQFQSKGLLGRYTLVVSPDIFASLQRIQPALGMMEAERISKMLNGRFYNAPVLGKNKAVMICAEPQYLDLALGMDMETGYLETKDFNHIFRIMETVALRIKCKDAIIVFE